VQRLRDPETSHVELPPSGLLVGIVEGDDGD